MEQLLRDDLVLTRRASGASFGVIARELGMLSREGARKAFRRARIRALVEVRARPVPSLATIAWAAGFFDGEGCIYGGEGIQAGRWRRFTFAVQVAQVRRQPLDVLATHWGGSVRQHQQQQPHHQDQWVWAIRGREAARFLTDLLPHLQVKAEPARAAIPCLFRTHKHGVPFTEDEVAGRRAAIAVIRAHNRRGKAVAS